MEKAKNFVVFRCIWGCTLAMGYFCIKVHQEHPDLYSLPLPFPVPNLARLDEPKRQLNFFAINVAK